MHPTISDLLVQAYRADLHQRARRHRLAREAREAREARPARHRRPPPPRWRTLGRRMLAVLISPDPHRTVG